MIDSDLFEQVTGDSLARSEHVYLETNFDLLGESSLREDRLDLGDHGGVDHPALGSNGMHLLSDPADDGKVLREVSGEDAGDAVGVQILKLGHF